MTDTGIGERQAPWTPDRERALEAMWLSGSSLNNMASVLHVSPNAVYNKAARLGLPRLNPPTAWSDSEVDELKRLWADGLSGSQIAGIIHRSRCAVLGKSFRLGLAERTEAKSSLAAADRLKRKTEAMTRRREYKAVKQREYRSKGVKPPTIVRKAEPWAGARNISLMERQPTDCAFPFGDGPFLFCGQPVMVGSSYCSHCYRVATARFVARPCVSAHGEGSG